MRKKTVRFDITDEQLKGIKFGENLTVTVKGRVIAAEESEKPTKEDKKRGFEGFPANLKLEIEDISFADGSFDPGGD